MSKGRKANPAKRATRRERVRSHIAKDLLTAKFRSQVVPDKKKKQDVTKMSHRDLVIAIQEEDEFK